MSLFSVHVRYISITFIIFIFFFIDFPSFQTAVSKKFQSDLSIIRTRELNFILRSKICVHYNGKLRASHLILGCMPSYTSYQDSLGALTVGSPLLFDLDVRLQGFMPHKLTSGKARH